MIHEPTHRDGNTLDLIFTNNVNYIHSFSSVTTALSDHHIVECRVSYMDHGSVPPQMDTSRPVPDGENVTFFDLNFLSDSINWESIRTAFSMINSGGADLSR